MYKTLLFLTGFVFPKHESCYEQISTTLCHIAYYWDPNVDKTFFCCFFFFCSQFSCQDLVREPFRLSNHGVFFVS